MISLMDIGMSPFFCLAKYGGGKPPPYTPSMMPTMAASMGI